MSHLRCPVEATRASITVEDFTCTCKRHSACYCESAGHRACHKKQKQRDLGCKGAADTNLVRLRTDQGVSANWLCH